MRKRQEIEDFFWAHTSEDERWEFLVKLFPRTKESKIGDIMEYFQQKEYDRVMNRDRQTRIRDLTY